MANSGAVVKIYRGDSLIATRQVPSRTGIYWTVFTVRNGRVSYSDRVSGDSPDTVQTADFELPANLNTIEDEAFAGCGFRTVRLHNGVTSIGSKAFSNCGELV
ncbi:leucine-rich repeat protein, partial [Vibrio sp. FNV 38]|nr:leucine-rich repeat protein [Vibrio sp. FNV 38]